MRLSKGKLAVTARGEGLIQNFERKRVIRVCERFIPILLASVSETQDIIIALKESAVKESF